MAARVLGKASSAFDKAPEGSEASSHLSSTDKLNVMVVADTDMLADRFWVQQSNFLVKLLLHLLLITVTL
ncbi:hypothetical protein [Paraglaciecola aquimarina]|uniref:hypothetical protein n=1 Tax=Paraglaciecola aquimarina TaxID=1235557 RepID=UPI003D16DD6A